MRCDRCYQETLGSTGWYFNMDKICMDCAEKERAHPDYQEAKEAELRAVQQGNYNFPGIGKPKDL